MSLGTILVSSLLATLSRPVDWPVALAGFLVRGGIVLFLLPIVVLPSPVGLSDRIAPTISAIALDVISPQLAVLIAAIIALAVAAILLAGWFAAATEAALIRDAPAWDELDPHRVVAPARRGESARILAARLVAHLPLVAVLSWSATRVVDAAYRELSRPEDVTTPIALRVLRSLPEVVVLIVITWVGGQVAGAVAARRVVLVGASAGGGLRAALGEFVRRPVQLLVLFLVPTAALVAVVVPTAAATASTWDRVRIAIAESAGPLEGIATVSVFVGLWLGGLLLVSMVSAWRAAAWTLDSEQRTFGVTPEAHPGDWSDTEPSGTL
jgi:hypothetical protein